MKISVAKNSGARPAQSERGSVVLILLLLLAIMAVYLASNNLALNNLHRELGLIEKKQTEKFARKSGLPSAKPGPTP